MAQAATLMQKSATRAGASDASALPHSRSLDASSDQSSEQTSQWLDFLKGHAIRTKLKVSSPDDPEEREADAVADRVMRMEAPTLVSPVAQTAPISRKCDGCKEDDELKVLPRRHGPDRTGEAAAPEDLEQVLASPGKPLGARERAFFEPRFGRDLGAVRVHNDVAAVDANRRIDAKAFTHGSHIYFGAGHQPGTDNLTAHELAHVVQQGSAPKLGETTQVPSPPANSPAQTIQRAPGDGMLPPGDCSWTDYIPLRIAKETAVAVAEGLGACSASDSCWRLAFKIAAFAAEIAAREAVAVKCFRGGDQGHIDQIAIKVRALNNCMAMFAASNCSPDLIAAARVVVEQIRGLLASLLVVTAVVATIAMIALVIAAIMALLELIAAALAAAAAGAAEAGLALAVSALLALMVSLKDDLDA
jgi:hypothetical protein